MVVGTGDLSELGLGWCTYGVGDHMSHYNPNGSVSKTLIQHLIRFVAASGDVGKDTAAILHDILDTEISPELIPAGADGAIQSTEQSVGPYALQDFNLFYLTRLGFRPSKIAFLAWNAWHDIDKGAWPANLPAGTRRAYRARRDPALAEAVPAALFHQPVQALGLAQRTQDLVRRLVVAARRLAGALGRQPGHLAGRARDGSREGEIERSQTGPRTKPAGPALAPPIPPREGVRWLIQR